MRKPSPGVMQETNRIGVQFLLTDIDAAFTFLNVAQTTSLPGHREQSLKHAAAAYGTVKRLLPRISPLPGELEVLQQKLAMLRRSLLDAGLSLEA